MVTLMPVRADTLPENASYRDNGCEVSPSCLICPLPVCKYDDPGWLRRVSRLSRDRAVIEARQGKNLSVADLAARFGLSARTIHRILQHERCGTVAGEALSPDSPVLRLKDRSLFRMPTPLPPMRRGTVRERRVPVRVQSAA